LRFCSVNVIQEYTPSKEARTVYFLNHNYWWDGLLPLYLSKKYFNQNIRAIMEYAQMQRYPFFSRIGAFSIDPASPKSSIKTLRYALESLTKKKSCLFIYPEGKIVPVSGKTSVFQNGLSWIYQHTEAVDFVPVGIYIDHSKYNKPELNIYIGNLVNHYKILSRSVLTELFKNDLDTALDKSRKISYQVHS
jgi:1-acyl-sn-glycerol-3-phosphate acyltransferase